LYDDACAGLLRGVFSDALLQRVDVVGVGERCGRVMQEFEFGVEQRRVEGGGYGELKCERRVAFRRVFYASRFRFRPMSDPCA
jgi:hypothetical protein